MDIYSCIYLHIYSYICIHVYIYKYTHMYTCIYTKMYTCILHHYLAYEGSGGQLLYPGYTYTHIYVYMYMYMCIQIFSYVYLYIYSYTDAYYPSIWPMNDQVDSCRIHVIGNWDTHIYMYTCIYVQIYPYVYSYIFSYIYIHTTPVFGLWMIRWTATVPTL